MPNFRFRPELLEGLPDHVTRPLEQYEDWFLLGPPALKKITDQFVQELNKGLTKEGGNIVSPLLSFQAFREWS